MSQFTAEQFSVTGKTAIVTGAGSGMFCAQHIYAHIPNAIQVSIYPLPRFSSHEVAMWF